MYQRMRRWVLALLALALLMGLAAAEEILYAVEVDLTNQITTVYRADGREHEDIVRQMICSTGTGGEDGTPLGEFVMKQHYPEERGEWYWIKKYEVYVQYPTRFNGPILFHSIPFAEMDLSTIDQQARSELGFPTSHGCVRLRSEDAKWIALNCPDGTTVRVYESGEVDEDLRAQLLKRTYFVDDWTSYEGYRSADIPAGLIGAVEEQLHEE